MDSYRNGTTASREAVSTFGTVRTRFMVGSREPFSPTTCAGSGEIEN